MGAARGEFHRMFSARRRIEHNASSDVACLGVVMMCCDSSPRLSPWLNAVGVKDERSDAGEGSSRGVMGPRRPHCTAFSFERG